MSYLLRAWSGASLSQVWPPMTRSVATSEADTVVSTLTLQERSVADKSSRGHQRNILSPLSQLSHPHAGSAMAPTNTAKQCF